MNIESAIMHLEENLKQHMKLLLPNDPFSDIYCYAVLPPGKLFRPQLVIATACDLSPAEVTYQQLIELYAPTALLASALEIHHAYTLVHDDLPCMDNDEWRRGKIATHKKFGEWQALLAGDGLLNASYRMISMIEHPNLPRLFKVITWALGPKGLIQGQVLDLSSSKLDSFQLLKKTHQLKTARLIQSAIVGGMLLIDSNHHPNRLLLDMYKLGNGIGVLFQLLDDLSELEQPSISTHELSVNGWIKHPSESISEALRDIETVENLLDRYQMSVMRKSIAHYLNTMETKINKGQESISNHLEKNGGIKVADLRPLMSALNRI
jgi:geranylgeranyl pyrophosphate synthase